MKYKDAPVNASHKITRISDIKQNQVEEAVLRLATGESLRNIAKEMNINYVPFCFALKAATGKSFKDFKTPISTTADMQSKNVAENSGAPTKKLNILQAVNPKLSGEWHLTKNAPLTPNDVTTGSAKKVWWICTRGHEWEAVVGNRSKGSGCPYCSGRKAHNDNCLQTIKPELAKEWHPTKNAPLTPKDVSSSSHKKVWWGCQKGHKWKATINSRSSGNSCPYCSGYKVHNELSSDDKPGDCKTFTELVYSGEPDKSMTGNHLQRKNVAGNSRRPTKKLNILQAVNPKLSGEWHPTKNAPLTPYDVTSMSGKKVWWRCRKGHEWEATIGSRSRGFGCPCCSGHKAHYDNCLLTTKPELAKEWHPTKNAPLTPNDVTSGSGKKVWWICSRGHEWEATIVDRSNGNGCPYCSGRNAHNDNCLQTIKPDIAKEWHPTKNAPLTPYDVTSGSGKKAWWICTRGHEWEATIAGRSKGAGCPYCSGNKVHNYNCLQTIKPDIAKEWHPTKNAPLTPNNVTTGSGKKVWWICTRGHEWEAVINNRSNGRGCPYCSSQKVHNYNCLQTIKPDIAKEWHPTKNAPLTPNDVTSRAKKKVWWICARGHEWEATIRYRAIGYGCPYCSERRPEEKDSLAVISPWIAQQWHPNKNRSWNPKDVSPHSKRNIWWECKHGHEYREPVIDRYRRGGCPVCILKPRK